GVVRQALAARPAWIIAKGGITSHDVALHGLGIRRAEVAGQLYPGLISVLRPVDGLAAAIGMPYVVFPGNVGDEQALTKVVAIMQGNHDSGQVLPRRRCVHGIVGAARYIRRRVRILRGARKPGRRTAPGGDLGIGPAAGAGWRRDRKDQNPRGTRGLAPGSG